MVPTATLLLAHLIADFPLQTDRIFRMKSSSARGLVLHVAIHIAVTVLLVRSALQFWPYWIILFVTHYLTDYTKLHWNSMRQTAGFVLDQVVHLVVIVLLGVALPQIESILPEWLLYSALLYAWIPAILMFLWIYAQNKGDASNSAKTRWMQNRLLLFSQVSGIPLILGVAAAALLFNTYL